MNIYTLVEKCFERFLCVCKRYLSPLIRTKRVVVVSAAATYLLLAKQPILNALSWSKQYSLAPEEDPGRNIFISCLLRRIQESICEYHAGKRELL